jgi:hypothetical protein
MSPGEGGTASTCAAEAGQVAAKAEARAAKLTPNDDDDAAAAAAAPFAETASGTKPSLAKFAAQWWSKLSAPRATSV